MECAVGTLHAIGAQPMVAAKTGGLGIVQGRTDMPLCAGRLMCVHDVVSSNCCAGPTAHPTP